LADRDSPRHIEVGIVIPNWEDTRCALSCVNSLRTLELSDGDFRLQLRIVVVDDASSGAVQKALGNALGALDDPRITFLPGETRAGFGASVNRGLEFLRSCPPHYVWLLNNDTVAEKAALLALVTAAGRCPEVRLWGSTLVTADDPEVLECAGGCRYSPLSTRIYPNHGGRRREELATLDDGKLDYIAGAAIFCRWEEIASVGGLSEDYFLYFEELDLATRLGKPRRLGWCRDSVLQHAGAASTAQPGRVRSALQQYYENLSTLRYTARHFPGLLPLVLVSRLFFKPCLFLVRREWHLYRPFSLALLDFAMGRPARVFSRPES
jgi:GT2 family glycosyltransferase